MDKYVEHARAIAAALTDVDGVAVRPDPPQTPMMHLHLRVDAEDYRATWRRLATEEKLWVWPRARSSSTPGWSRVELTVGDATLEVTPDDVREIVVTLLGSDA
jgi:hypothetical protein